MIPLPKEINVLYVDDEQNYLTAFRAAFRWKFNIYTALTADEACEVLHREHIHVVIADNRMPGTSGVAFFKYMMEQYPAIIRMLITAYQNASDMMDAVNIAHVFRYMLKPWNETELECLIREGYEIYVKESGKEQLINTLEFFLRQKLLS